MGKIGDLFVRLGLKSDGFKRGMNDAKKETQGFGAALGKMKSGALAVWAAIGAGAVKLGQDFISSTNKMADAWAKTMGGMKSAWQMVKASIANWDFKDFGQKLAESFKAGMEKEEAFDAEFELVNSVKLRRQAIQQELNELYAQMRDTSASNEVRKAAQERYRALLQPIADAEIEVYGNMLDAAISEWQAGTGLNRTRNEIIEFFKKIGTDADAMKAKYADIFNVYETSKGDVLNQGLFDIIAKYQEAANQMSNVEREMARVTNAINADIKRSLESIADAVKTYGQEDLKLDLKVDIDVEEVDMSDADAILNEFLTNLQNKHAEIADLNQMIEDSFIQSFSGAVQSITDAAFGIEGAGFEQVMAAVMQPIASTAIRLGEMLIAEGLAIDSFKESLAKLDPGVAIAAGAALIAVGAALTSGIKALGGGGGAGATSASTGAGSSTPSGVETYEQEITVHVKGEIAGDKIVIAGQKTLNKWNR